MKNRQEPSPEFAEKVHEIAKAIDSLIRGNRYSIGEATAALMLLTAKGCAFAIDTDDGVVKEFRRCLEEARVAYAEDVRKVNNHAIN